MSGEHAPAAVDADDGVATVSTGDAFLALWKSGATPSRIRWVNTRVLAHVERAPEGIVAAQFLLPSATPPGLREVSALREGLDVVLPRSRRLVAIPLGDARWQAVVRSVMRAGLAILGQSEKIKVAATPAEALALLAQASSARTPSPDGFAHAARALFAALDEQAPDLR